MGRRVMTRLAAFTHVKFSRSFSALLSRGIINSFVSRSLPPLPLLSSSFSIFLALSFFLFFSLADPRAEKKRIRVKEYERGFCFYFYLVLFSLYDRIRVARIFLSFDFYPLEFYSPSNRHASILFFFFFFFPPIISSIDVNKYTSF